MNVGMFKGMLLLCLYSCRSHGPGGKRILNYNQMQSGRHHVEKAKKKLRHHEKDVHHPNRHGHNSHHGHGGPRVGARHVIRGHGTNPHGGVGSHGGHGIQGAHGVRRHKPFGSPHRPMAQKIINDMVDKMIGPVLGNSRRDRKKLEHELGKKMAEKEDERLRNLGEIGRTTAAQVALEELKDIEDDKIKDDIMRQELFAKALNHPTTADPALKEALDKRALLNAEAEKAVDDMAEQAIRGQHYPPAINPSRDLKEAENREVADHALIKPPAHKMAHKDAVEAIGNTAADEEDAMLAVKGFPAQIRKAIAADAGLEAAKQANKDLTNRKINDAEEMVQKSAEANKKLHDELRHLEAASEKEAQRLRALREGLSPEVAEKLGEEAYEESMGASAGIHPGPSEDVVKAAAKIAGDAVESFHVTEGAPPSMAAAAGNNMEAAVMASTPLPRTEEEALAGALSREPKLMADDVDEIAQAHGFVPAEELVKEKLANQELHDKAEEIINNLDNENHNQAVENKMLMEGIRNVSPHLMLDKPKARQYKDAEAIENTRDLMRLPPELVNAALEDVKVISPDLDKIEVKEGTMNLPFKIASDNVTNNQEELKYVEEKDKINDKLEGTVSPTKFETDLNTIETKDGTINLPKTAKELNIKKGQAFFNKEEVEKMKKDGQNVSQLTQIINKGENPDIPEGTPYYMADLTKAVVPLPSATNPTPSSMIETESGALNLAGANKLVIEQGTVIKTPTSEFLKHERPSVNEEVEGIVVPTPEEKKAVEETIEALDNLRTGETSIREGVDGGHVVTIKPQVGSPIQMGFEEMMEGLEGTAGKPAQHKGGATEEIIESGGGRSPQGKMTEEEIIENGGGRSPQGKMTEEEIIESRGGRSPKRKTTKEEEELFKAMGGHPTRKTESEEEHQSLNVLKPPSGSTETIEEEVIRKALERSGQTEDITVENGFTNKPGSTKQHIVEKIEYGEGGIIRPDGIKITNKDGKYKVQPKSTKEIITEEGEVKLVDKKPNAADLLVARILGNLLTDPSKKAPVLEMTEEQYTYMIRNLPMSLLKDYFNHAIKQIKVPRDTIQTTEQLVGKDKAPALQALIYGEIAKMIGKGSPNKRVVRRQVKPKILPSSVVMAPINKPKTIMMPYKNPGRQNRIFIIRSPHNMNRRFITVANNRSGHYQPQPTYIMQPSPTQSQVPNVIYNGVLMTKDQAQALASNPNKSGKRVFVIRRQ